MNGALNLVLIGYMGTGKSTIGRRCAHALGYTFRDTDRIVEIDAGMSVADVFATRGEEGFRRLEAMAIRRVASFRRTVVATGGGAVLRPSNVRELQRRGVIVLLDVAPSEIVARVSRSSKRPLLEGAEDRTTRVMEMLDARKDAYESAADVVVSTTGLSVAEASDLVLLAFREFVAKMDQRGNRP